MNPDCVCLEPGWCQRHQCRKTAHWFDLCRSRCDYFILWEEGRGPGQNLNGQRPLPETGPTSVAVIIPCHNYGRFLGRAIESVLAQTWKPEEIVVIDDRSTDDSREVALRYADQGVRYLKVDFGNVHDTRRAGFESTTSQAVCFLDADDYLAEDYLEQGLRQFTEKRVALVYSDMIFFGARKHQTDFPAEFDRERFTLDNYLHAGSLVRREVLEVSRAFDYEIDPLKTQGDYFLWRKVLSGIWTARKQKGLYYYRQHEVNWTQEMHRVREPGFYFDYTGLEHEEITLFIPLSGRSDAWQRQAEFLNHQTWPHDRIRLILLDTSNDHGFHQQLKLWIAECDYADVRLRRELLAETGIADANRRDENVRSQVVLAMWRIYQRLLEMSETDYLWILEDDVFPPLDVCRRLLQEFDPKTGAVAAPYPSRHNASYLVWNSPHQEFRRRGKGVETVGGTGFGCIILKRASLSDETFVGDRLHEDYDIAFMRTMKKLGLAHKVVWPCLCEHGIESGTNNGTSPA